VDSQQAASSPGGTPRRCVAGEFHKLFAHNHLWSNGPLGLGGRLGHRSRMALSNQPWLGLSGPKPTGYYPENASFHPQRYHESDGGVPPKQRKPAFATYRLTVASSGATIQPPPVPSPNTLKSKRQAPQPLRFPAPAADLWPTGCRRGSEYRPARQQRRLSRYIRLHNPGQHLDCSPDHRSHVGQPGIPRHTNRPRVGP
jgi:hypothetical protein